MSTNENWGDLYLSALHESDPSKLADRITKARNAIVDRIEELHEPGEGEEMERLRVALEILGELRLVAENRWRRPDAA